ncbi:hypothetical protein DEU56DRAFT_720701, partial [Suillus clintonianus]|uniref:uncharacterized protein n=1 Tax=Suillus clintonianus TaxID=1904413 RepID=UPI001B8625EA
HHYVYNQAHNQNLQIWVGKRVKRVIFESGISVDAVLKRCGIEQLVDLPGVGENYRDHNGAFLPHFAADEAVTMDPPLAPFNRPNIVENLAKWKIDAKSLVAQKLHFSGSDAKIKWRPDGDELEAMGSAFQPRWKEFFQDRPDKAVAIFCLFEG